MALKRVGTDHPRVCQRANPTGPCVYEAEPGALYCAMHGGSGAALAAKDQELRNYKLNNVLGGRTRELASSPGVKNLNDEIALMRATLETVVNSLDTASAVILHVEKIERLNKGIRDTIEVFQKLQEKNKELLGRDTVLAIFDAIMTKIAERVTDPDVIQALAQDGCEIISKSLGG